MDEVPHDKPITRTPPGISGCLTMVAMGALSIQMSIFGCDWLPTASPVYCTPGEAEAIYQSFSGNILAKKMKRFHSTGAFH
eukprot:8903814-Karenia_brevis.AAC.1